MSSIWVAAVATPNRKLPRPASPDSGPYAPNWIGPTSASLPPQAPRGSAARTAVRCRRPNLAGEGGTECIVPEIPYTAQLRDGQGNAVQGAGPGPSDPPPVRGAAGARR